MISFRFYIISSRTRSNLFKWLSKCLYCCVYLDLEIARFIQSFRVSDLFIIFPSKLFNNGFRSKAVEKMKLKTMKYCLQINHWNKSGHRRWIRAVVSELSQKRDV